MTPITLLSKSSKYGHNDYTFEVVEGTTAGDIFKWMREDGIDFPFGASLEWRSPTRAVVSVNTD